MSSAAKVDPVRTPITATDLYDALAAAWPGVVGGAMPHLAGVMLVAQSALECGAGWANCWNGNVGNLAGMGGSAYVMLHASDGNFRPYRAYPTLDGGIVDWLSLMTHEPGALTAAAAGDVPGFVAGLVAGKYFQESPTAYTAGVQSRFATYSTQLAALPAPAPPPDTSTPPSSGKLLAVVFLALVTLWAVRT